MCYRLHIQYIKVWTHTKWCYNLNPVTFQKGFEIIIVRECNLQCLHFFQKPIWPWNALFHQVLYVHNINSYRNARIFLMTYLRNEFTRVSGFFKVKVDPCYNTFDKLGHIQCAVMRMVRTPFPGSRSFQAHLMMSNFLRPFFRPLDVKCSSS